MGRVTLMWDEQRQEEVALKRVTVPGASARIDFKREFRRVERLLHPGLVRLHELDEDEDGLFFTMEPIDGLTLLEYCRGFDPARVDSQGTTDLADTDGTTAEHSPGMAAPTVEDTTPAGSGSSGSRRTPRVAPGTFELPRLARVLPPILEALSFLHAHGLVHRDLKPRNVMVDRDGDVKLLDFGILAKLGREAGRVAGTPGYMSPEQIRGEPAEPASDCYALGATLFELVSGRRPWSGESSAVLYQQLETDAPRLTDFAPDAPPPLVEACGALLDRVPVARPTLEDVARTLLPAIGAREAQLERRQGRAGPLVGRRAHKRRLHGLLGATPGVPLKAVVLSGPTGVGKSSLLEWVGDVARRRGMAVLRGRGRPSERVPYNAVDGAIDDLAGLLAEPLGPTVDAVQARTAASAFPVLQPADDPPPPDSVTRPTAFRALGRVVEEVAGDVGLALLIDDLQWADADGVALLDHLVRDAPRSVLVAMTLRDDVEPSQASAWARHTPGVELIPVPELDEEELGLIVTRMAHAAGGEPVPERVARAVAECGGRPFFAELAGRLLGRGDGGTEGRAAGAVAGLIEPLPLDSRTLLAAVAATDGWTSVADLAEVLGRVPGVLVDDLRGLEQDGLVRRSGAAGAEGLVDLYHDVVRVAVHEVLGADALRQAHQAFADALVRREDADPLRRIHHLLGAGRVDDAARRARTAAAVAEGRQAHDLAATLYRVAADHLQEDRAELLDRRAQALERAARYNEAARCWRELAGADPGRADDAAIREAHALFAADRGYEARDRLDQALRGMGERPIRDSKIADLFTGARFVLGPGKRAAREDGATARPEVLRRAERDVRVALMLMFYWPLTGLRFTRSARDRFDRLGATDQAAWCDYLFAYFSMVGTRLRGAVPLAERYIDAARARLGGVQASAPEAAAMEPLLRGIAASREGQWEAARVATGEAAEILEREGLHGTYLHLHILSHLAGLDLYEERVPPFAESHQRFEDAARESLHTAMHGQIEGSAVALLVFQDRLEEARDRVLAYLDETRDHAPTVYRNTLEVASALPELYLTDGHEARRRIHRALRVYRAQRPWNHMFVGTIAGLSALTEANALRTGDPEASARQVERYARKGEGTPPFYTGGIWRARAYAADALGQPERAVQLLTRAEDHALRNQQMISASIARFQRGLRLGGDEGGALCDEARLAITEAGATERLLQEDAGLR